MAATALIEHDPRATDESLEQLYREHAPTVYRYALGTVGNPADAEDVVQTTFTGALRALRRGEQPEKPENWLITIAHNECRQRFRRLGRRAHEVPLDAELPTVESDVAEAAETTETIGDVLHALAELPFNQRAALVLREVSGRSAAEIAECLGTSRAAVDMLVFRARQTIRTNVAGVRALALVPLPRSLLSLMGGPAGTAGGLAAGIGGVVKLVAVAAAAVTVATSAGSTSAGSTSAAEAGAAAEPRTVPSRAVADVRERAPARATKISTPTTRAQAPTGRAAPAPSARDTALAPPAQLASAPVVELPAVQVAPPTSTRVSLPPLLASPVKQAAPSLPEVSQLPPGLPKDVVEVTTTVTEVVPSPGITLPDAGTGTLP